MGLAACARPAGTGDGGIVATVGRQTITAGLRDYYIEQQTGAKADQVAPGLRARLEAQLLGLAAAADLADGSQQAAQRHAVELARLQTLAQAAADAAGVNAPPSEGELEAAYRLYVSGLPAQEFHVAHVLVATPVEADAVLRRLARGESFASVAREASADESGARGGDIGWIFPGHLPEAFMSAVESLRPGQYTARAVQTSYGYHVIRLLETRTPVPPSFASVRAQLAANLKGDRYRKFLAEAGSRTPIRLSQSAQR